MWTPYALHRIAFVPKRLLLFCVSKLLHSSSNTDFSSLARKKKICDKFDSPLFLFYWSTKRLVLRLRMEFTPNIVSDSKSSLHLRFEQCLLDRKTSELFLLLFNSACFAVVQLFGLAYFVQTQKVTFRRQSLD